MKLEQDPEAAEFWNATIYGVGSPDPDPMKRSIATCGKSREEARLAGAEALTGVLLSSLEKGLPTDPPARLPRGTGWEWVSPAPRVEVALAIRAAREEARLTQAEAARLMGVAQTTYTRWEQPGKCNATLSTLEKVAKVFGRRVEVTLV